MNQKFCSERFSKNHLLLLIFTFSMYQASFSQDWVEQNTSHFSREALKKISFDLKSLTGAPQEYLKFRSGMMEISGIETENPVLGLLVQTNGDRAELEAQGALVGSQHGNIFSLHLPADRLNDLASLSNVISIEPSIKCQLSLDSSLPDTRANEVRQGDYSVTPPVYTGYAGKNVLVITIDTGIDWQHEDFINDNDGTSRILYIWDQTITGSGTTPGDFPYGREYTQSDINDEIDGTRTYLVDSYDYDAHGTHVMGIMAGDGSSTGDAINYPPYTYVGMAPQANIIAVKTNFYESGILDAIQYAFDKALDLNMPAVINLSLGNHFRAHDGTSLFEQAINNASDYGRIIVVSAGNEGTDAEHGQYFHAEVNITTGVSQMLTFDVPEYTPNSGGGNDFVDIVIWYQGQDNINIELISPSGFSLDVNTGMSTIHSRSEGRILIDNAETGPDAQNGDNCCRITIWDYYSDRPPGSGQWKINLFGNAIMESGHADAWIALTQLGDTTASFSTAQASVEELISIPGTAEEVITVAAHSTRTSWVDNDGDIQSIHGAKLNDLAFFSSPGPTRDDPGFIAGRQKPDISAPGFGVISAYSSRASYIYNDYRNEDGQHLMLWGTSMAAPHVAGAVALMLDKNPTLASQEIKSILTSNTRTDVYTGPVPNYNWGFGKLDVYEAIQDIPASEAPDITVTPDNFNLDISTNQSVYDNMTIGNNGLDDLYYNLSIGLTVYSPPANKSERTAESDITARQAALYFDSKTVPPNETAGTMRQSFLPFAEASFPEQTILSEGFENAFPPEGWTQIHGDSATRDWNRTSSASVSGRYSAISNWGYDLDEWLITPSLDFSGATSAALSFWWGSSYTYHVLYDRGDLFVKVSVDGGQNWETLWTFGEIGRWENWTWYQTTLDLSGYQGEPGVMIAFHVLADDNADIVLDHIFVTTKPWISVSQSSGRILAGGNEDISVEFNAHNLFAGTYGTNIVVKSNDPDDPEVFIPVTLNVTNNQPIITSIPDTMIQVGENYNYQVIAEDADGDELAYSLALAPAWLSINAETGLITGTPSVSDTGISRIEIEVSDGNGGLITQIYSLHIVPTGTAISGTLTGILSASSSPYIIEGDITIPNGQVLLIEPGVQLRFNGYYQFLVEGNLQAMGTEDNRIVFTRHRPAEDSRWPGIHLLNADDTTKIVYCKIEYGLGTDETFSHSGGAVYCESSNLFLKNSELANNDASHGGGIRCTDSRVLISECIFKNNTATSYGGALGLYNGHVLLLDNILINNSAGYGAAIYSYDGDHVMAYNVVTKNIAESDVGGIYIREGNPILCNNTIVENQNERMSISGLASYSDETTTIINCIIWNNAGDNIYISSQGTANVTYCNIPGEYPGMGNINSDPQFIDPTVNNYRLNPGSPCIDRGDPAAIYNDLNGTRNDMGAFGGSKLAASHSFYDFGQIGQGGSAQFNLILYNIKSTGFIINSLQLSDTVNFDIPVFDYPISIAPYQSYTLRISYTPQSQGSHTADLLINSNEFSGATSSAVRLEGNAFGIAGNISGLWTKNNSPYIINGDVIIPENDSLIIEPGVEFLFNGRYDLTVYGTLKAVGIATDSIRFTRYLPNDSLNWAGLRFYRGSDSSELTYCIIEYSDGQISTYGQGGALRCSSTSIKLTNSSIRNNKTYNGAGIYVVNSQIVLDNVSIENNQSSSAGAAIYSSSSDLVLNQCIINNNTAGGSGAGIYTQNSEFLISNSIILNNVSEYNGGAIYYREFTSGAMLTLNNCIIFGNEASDGDGLFISDGDVKILNSIVWNNSDSDLYVSTIYGDSMLVSYTNIMQEVWSGIGNMSQDPLFTNPAGNDFHLNNNSPCVNSGHPHSLFNDLDGSPNDMGMYGGSGLLPEFIEYDFGPVDVSGDESVDFKLQNFRGSSIMIDSLYLQYGDYFQINNSTNRIIPAHTEMSVEVNFDPRIDGYFSDNLIMQSSDFYGVTESAIKFNGQGTGQPPSLTIQSPNGGEEWPVGSDQIITWTSYGPIENVKLEYSVNGGTFWNEITTSTLNDGNYLWEVPETASDRSLLRISEAVTGDPWDVSDSLFTLSDESPPSQVTELTAAVSDSCIILSWSPAADNIGLDHYQVYCDTTSGFTPADAIGSSADTFFVHCDPIPGKIYYYCVSAVDLWGNAGAYSDEVWAVITFLTITAPNGGEEWPINSEQHITWHTSVSVGDVKLEYTIDQGLEWNIITDNTPNDGSYLWEVPKTPSRSSLVRISEASDGIPWDISDSLFILSDESAPSQVLNLTAAATDTSIILSWSPAADNIGLDHYQVYCDTTSGFTPADAMGSSADTFFVHSDPIPGKIYYYRVSAVDSWGNEGVYSKEVWSVITFLTITAPNGGEMWPITSEQNITWNTSVSVGDVKLEYSTDDGLEWHSITENTPNDGSYIWEVPESPSRSSLVRISESSDGNPWDISDSLFSMSDNNPPSKVIDLSAVANDTCIILSWSAAADNIGVDHYQVYCDITSGFTPNDAMASCTDTFFVHSDPIPEINYFYRISAVDLWGNEGEYSDEVSTFISDLEEDQQVLVPDKYILDQNYPNPFNPVTNIRYGLPEATHVLIEITNIIGQRVETLVNEYKQAGYHIIQFDSRGLASGIYFYYIKTNKFYAMKKLVLLK